MTQQYVGAIDQGTTSTRFMIFDHDGAEVARHQLEHEQILPRAGWVEHDAQEIWSCTQDVVKGALESAGLTAADLVAVGITNQRETTVVWDRRTGEPYANAIVWQDTRTDKIAAVLKAEHGDTICHRSGLPPAAYFAGGKLKWLLENVDGLRDDAEAGHAIFGTIDSWLIWWLTGGPATDDRPEGRHVTDVTNASRTMLMDLESLAWDDELVEILDVPRQMLPEIASSSEEYGLTVADGPFGAEVPVAGDLGDQHAALFGQVCFEPGELKNTYGTGNFLVLNTGEEIVRSTHGLLTTVGYKLGDAPAVYALEGSIAVTGSAVQWLRDQLGIISEAAEVEELAASVDDNGGVSFVPAFSGLFAPYWRPDARGALVGLSRFNTKAHVARATLESICYQSKDVVDAMVADADLDLKILKVDGGITANELCMQVQADVLGVEVSKPVVPETTCLGAAYAAGLAVGFWSSTDELSRNWSEAQRWSPTTEESERAEGYAQWKKAVERTLDWVE
ncbi:glycerol kinase [Aeromicrobium sp. Root495]|uniref:glycerol kinase GlpK n=1 Tax=Aeromicrobium sp. Root495 TaxID=1736550 RepID=UPI0006F55741|nr:glycerol kinase GlpK [Aeromicrobium sp. Root495]KQY58674.1 glycerol kinase [Aeromicrobium sp. Root495]